MPSRKVTERFTETVSNYLKYRPSYPKAVVSFLVKHCLLDETDVIADIGSGTGFLAELFLEQGCQVYGIEPNDPMRAAGEMYLKKYPKFQSLVGVAEAIPLAEKSVNFVTVGTAFHWFDAKKAKVEFYRILKPQGWIVLIWNVRDLRSPLMQAYENLILTYSLDYSVSAASQFEKTVDKDFFAPQTMHLKTFDNNQYFDWMGLKGRLLSTSYCLPETDARYQEMIMALRDIFEKYQKNGKVEFLYETKMYYATTGGG